MVAMVINLINQCEKSAKYGASDNYLNVKKTKTILIHVHLIKLMNIQKRYI